MAKQREFGLDLTRATAVTLVLSVHFFLNSGFYDVPIQGAGMAAATVGRMACMTCVPMFMMLTGWLCIDRQWSGRYFLKLLPILLTYVLTGCLCVLFQIRWLGAVISPLGLIGRLLNFSAAPYGWYIEMYIGMFLIAPFLNAMWKGLNDNVRLALVITMLLITALPTVANILVHILPDQFTIFYPVTYYFLGAWLREHPVRVNGRLLFLGWAVLSVLAGGVVCWQQWGGLFTYQQWNYYQSLLVVGESVCLFSLLARCKGTGMPGPVRWCVRKLAQLSLPLYLLSYITDSLLYPHLMAAVPNMPARLPWLPVMVLAGLVGAGVMAQAVDWAVKALMRLAPKTKEQRLVTIQEIPVEEIESFWDIHFQYLVDDGIIADGKDKGYFQSSEYRNTLKGQMLCDKDRHHMVYFVRNGIRIGACQYRTFQSSDGECFIMDFWVFPEYRGSGTGHDCFNALLEYTQKDGALYYVVNCAKEDSRRFWLSLGFADNGFDEYGDRLMIWEPFMRQRSTPQP